MNAKHEQIIEELKNNNIDESTVRYIYEAFEKLETFDFERNKLYHVTMPMERYKRYIKFVEENEN